MRYLIFNVTVLAALGYLFMASPDQSFANWIGKAPQMFDAARMAGRGPVADGNPEATAGSALLEAVEPVVDQVLSTSDGMYSEPAPTDGPSEATPPSDIHAIAATQGTGAWTCPCRSQCRISRASSEAFWTQRPRRPRMWPPAANPRPEVRRLNLSSQGRVTGRRAARRHMRIGRRCRSDIAGPVRGEADDAAQSQAALQDMNDEEIAAAFEPFRQSASSEPVTPRIRARRKWPTVRLVSGRRSGRRSGRSGRDRQHLRLRTFRLS